MSRLYAGIGSRKTPIAVCRQMTQIAQDLRTSGYTLRSGRAAGADQAFEHGAGNQAEIFTARSHIPTWAFDTVDKYHPNPGALSDYARCLHARNAMILLGESGLQRVDFVICWTVGGKTTGGTGQALRIARDLNIDVINLFNQEFTPPIPGF